jgi:hypothetical protein
MHIVIVALALGLPLLAILFARDSRDGADWRRGDAGSSRGPRLVAGTDLDHRRS